MEQFDYPGAADILASDGIQLKQGDGHIVLVTCDGSADQIRVYTVADSAAGRRGDYCFQATATLRIPHARTAPVFALETGDHPISADLTANGATTTVDVPEGDFESVGEGVRRRRPLRPCRDPRHRLTRPRPPSRKRET